MLLYTFVKPLGIIAYIFLVTAAITGFLKAKLRWHKTLAITALILATIHGIIVIIISR